MKAKSVFSATLLFVFVFFLSITCSGQWNLNTAVNLEISSLEVADMETASTTDGKTWIAFYAVNGSNYDMRAQLLDANGNKLLGADGMLVSNQPSGSATFVFNVCVDASNNLIIGNQDNRSGSMHAVLYKISQSGTHLWSSTGVVLGLGLAPYPAVLSNGEVIVSWNDDATSTLSLQKITTGGTTAWTNPISITIGSSNTTRGQLIGNTSGKFTLVCQKMGFGISTTLYAQMFDNSGNALYTALQISDLTTSAARYYSITSSADTTYCGYYASSGMRFNSFLQRINPGGTIPWGMNGSNFNTYIGSSDNYQMETEINLSPGSGYVWAVCTFSNPSQSQYGVYVQKFLRTSGARQFTDAAKVVYAISANSDRQCGNLALINDTPMFSSYDANYKIYATRLDASGNFTWPGNRVEISSTTAGGSTPKMRYGFTPDGPNRCAGTWTENRGTYYKGYAQGISVGGLIGVDVNTQGGVPAVINTPGGTLQMVATVYPSTANQNVTWSIVPVTGGASISTTGLVTAFADGTVYAKAVAVQDVSMKDSMLITITNQIPLPPTVTTLAATNVTGTGATLNGSVVANGSSTTVTFNWGLTAAYGNTVSATPSTVTGNTPTPVSANLTGLQPSTTYHFRCVGVNSVGTTYGSDLTFTTCQPPDAAGVITGPTSVCQYQTGVIYSTTPIQYATSYIWTVPNGATITAGSGTTQITVTFSGSSTSGNVTVAGTNSCTTGPSSSLGVTVNTLPNPTITGSTSPCMESGTFTYTTEPGMTNYTWVVSPGGTIQSGSGTNAVVVQWNNTGAQTLSVNYTNAGGCQAQSPTVLNITVYGIPSAAGPVSGEPVVCAGTDGVEYSVDPIANATSYIWTVPTGATIVSGSGTNEILVDFSLNAVSGAVSVYGNSICGNGAASGMDVTVNPAPPTPVVDSNGFVLTSSAQVGNQWYKDGVMIPGATGQEYIVSENGWYWTVVTINGCPSEESNHIYILVTNAGQEDAPAFSIYPNPNDGHFTISFPSMTEAFCTVEIINPAGMQIFRMDNVEVALHSRQDINLGGLPCGMYTVIVKGEKGKLVRKMIIE